MLYLTQRAQRAQKKVDSLTLKEFVLSTRWHRSHGWIRDLGFVFLEITQTSLDSSKGN